MEKRIQESETRQFKVVFPNTLNANDMLFGGTVMQWMDEVAYITATRFTRQKTVTVSTDKINFKHSIPFGTIVEIVGKVVEVGNVKLVVQIEIFVEQMYRDERKKAIEGRFTFAAINDEHKPIKLNLPTPI
jgi:acyl-CoA hydrolase